MRCNRWVSACNRLKLRWSPHTAPPALTGLFDAFKGPQITVSKIQVAVQCDSRGPSSVLGAMADIADEADTETDEGLEEMVSDVALALLRAEVDWISGCSENIKVKACQTLKA